MNTVDELATPACAVVETIFLLLLARLVVETDDFTKGGPVTRFLQALWVKWYDAEGALQCCESIGVLQSSSVDDSCTCTCTES